MSPICRVDGTSLHDLDFEDDHEREGDDMPMKNPPHLGEVIRKEILEALGLSITRADVLEVRRATLSDLVNRKAALSGEMALRIGKAFGVSMDMLLGMQAAHDAVQARARAAHIAIKPYAGS
jgi:addiction module HigA family antidote